MSLKKCKNRAKIEMIIQPTKDLTHPPAIYINITYLKSLDNIINNPKYSISKGHPKGSTRLKSFLEKITPQKPQVVLIRIATKYSHIE